jgi:DNA-binding GntR family transcriptional regulator
VTANRANEQQRDNWSLVSKAYAHILDGIISGRYEPSSSLRLQALANEIGMSMIPVREALRRLEAEHLVRITPNRGAQVAPLSLEDVQDAYTVRIILEVEALRRSFSALTEEDIARARKLTDRMVRLLERGDEAGYEPHRELHFILYEKANSRWMMRTIETLWSHTERYRRLATELRGDPEEIGSEHGAVLDAVERGDEEAAVSALRTHLERSVAVLAESPAFR